MAAELALRRTSYSLHADLSGRWLELRKGGRRLRRITVGIGASGSETPTGRFAVTDELSGPSYSASYGCCILALSGHQQDLRDREMCVFDALLARRRVV